jgi:serine/threonine protein kinase
MPLEGLHLGTYRLLRLLGSGGMGEVYLAEDARIGQQVAIKVIRSEGLASPGSDVSKEAVRLFEREAKAIARLDHPNILPLYAYGEEMLNDTRLTYLVMPYRKEGTLATWLRQRGGSHLLSPAEVVPLLQQAANALQHAHDQQIIHQDVKPTNFLIRLRSDRPHRPDLLLADFGIAKLTSATASTSQNIRGTPIYMAPEQWDGHPVPATDQYALAIMAYELLVGRPPFRGGPGQVMHQHYMTPPPAPSTLNPRLSAAIDTVLLCALAKQPEQRFASVSAFVQAFRQAVQRGGDLSTAEKLSRTVVRSEIPPLPEPILPPAQESRVASTVMPANATSLPTEPVTPARKTPFPTELTRSTTPSAGRPEVMLPTRPTQGSTSRRLVLGGLAGLTIVGIAGSITWLARSQASPTSLVSLSSHQTPTTTPLSRPTPDVYAQSLNDLIGGTWTGTGTDTDPNTGSPTGHTFSLTLEIINISSSLTQAGTYNFNGNIIDKDSTYPYQNTNLPITGYFFLPAYNNNGNNIEFDPNPDVYPNGRHYQAAVSNGRMVGFFQNDYGVNPYPTSDGSFTLIKQ